MIEFCYDFNDLAVVLFSMGVAVWLGKLGSSVREMVSSARSGVGDAVVVFGFIVATNPRVRGF